MKSRPAHYFAGSVAPDDWLPVSCYKRTVLRLSHSGRIVCLLLVAFLAAGCGGRTIGKKSARNVIADISPSELDPEDVEVESVGRTGSSNAVIEARVRVAFRVENERGRWVVRELRIGRHQWEKLERVLEALERVKVEETRRTLERLSSAIEEYFRKNGSIPAFKDFVALSDALYPNYLADIIRLDAWNRPLLAERLDGSTIRLSSAGPDGQPRTGDDIELIRSYP